MTMFPTLSRIPFKFLFVATLVSTVGAIATGYLLGWLGHSGILEWLDPIAHAETIGASLAVFLPPFAIWFGVATFFHRRSKREAQAYNDLVKDLHAKSKSSAE